MMIRLSADLGKFAFFRRLSTLKGKTSCAASEVEMGALSRLKKEAMSRYRRDMFGLSIFKK